MNKKLFLPTLFAFIFASQLFSQAKWVPSTWPDDSVNISHSKIKPVIEEFFRLGWQLAKKINVAPTIGNRVISVSDKDTFWRKEVICDCGVKFEAGANIKSYEPYWFSITTNNVHVLVAPNNNYAKVWTNWGRNTDEPHWVFYNKNQNEFNTEGEWVAADKGIGQFTEADLIRVQNVLGIIKTCVPPYQKQMDFSKPDSITRAAITRADSIPDPEGLSPLSADLDKLFGIKLAFESDSSLNQMLSILAQHDSVLQQIRKNVLEDFEVLKINAALKDTMYFLVAQLEIVEGENSAVKNIRIGEWRIFYSPKNPDWVWEFSKDGKYFFYDQRGAFSHYIG